MRAFLRSVRFKVLAIILAVLVVLLVVFSALGGWTSPLSSVASSVVTPVQQGFNSTWEYITNLFSAPSRIRELELENAELREQIAELTEAKTEYETALVENEFYKDYLGLKEDHEDFEFCAAKVVSIDPVDAYGAFSINMGSLNGISPYDPVITAEGLVGYVKSVSLTSSTVVTVLDPTVKAGAYDTRTDDSGIVVGSAKLAKNGQCRMNDLTRDCTVAIGDSIVTSGGGGIFPEGLMVGTVNTMGQDVGDIMYYAVIDPAVNFEKLRNVMVITAFEGQTMLKDRI
ncbi:MAG: rod shape-determining protein MreC [Acutalibacteraceae bacterium]|nr:rod shape-determining protein MreC [Clostridia bacterium]MBQ2420287.1 rod shape-determining protein MreC [Clostridia bacterium]MBQ5597519.1 rod shape-determining protein MreC [Clostridia bacterium]MEE1126609.1 rod shape-determining protein MreC [Acutalibacteraceae bacterium]